MSLKEFSSIIICLCCGLLYSQVGINTDTPKAVLDVVASDPSAPNSQDGFLPPRVSVLPTGMTAEQTGMMVYLTTAATNTPVGLYIFNGTDFQNIITLVQSQKSAVTGTLSTNWAAGGDDENDYSIIEFDQEQQDSRNEFNTTTHTFTATQFGYYNISVRGQQNNYGGSVTHEIAIFKNGTLLSSDRQFHNGGQVVRQVFSAAVPLDIGDTIDFRFNKKFITLENDQDLSFFTIQQI